MKLEDYIILHKIFRFNFINLFTSCPVKDLTNYAQQPDCHALFPVFWQLKIKTFSIAIVMKICLSLSNRTDNLTPLLMFIIVKLIRVMVMVFSATFNNISVISWQLVLLLEETGVPGENHQPAASHWQTLSHNVVLSTPYMSSIQTHNVSGDSHWLHR